MSAKALTTKVKDIDERDQKSKRPTPSWVGRAVFTVGSPGLENGGEKGWGERRNLKKEEQKPFCVYQYFLPAQAGEGREQGSLQTSPLLTNKGRSEKGKVCGIIRAYSCKKECLGKNKQREKVGAFHRRKGKEEAEARDLSRLACEQECSRLWWLGKKH